jgi:carbon monoxide dehydrogenase subunit G
VDIVIIENQTTIARPAEDVFAFVADPRNDPKWHTDVLEARRTDDGPVGAGTTYAVSFKPFMGQSEGTMTVREYAPPERVVFDGRAGSMAPTVTLTVEPDGAGSRFTRRVQIPPRGLLRILAPLMTPMARREADRFLANLKRELESQ